MARKAEPGIEAFPSITLSKNSRDILSENVRLIFDQKLKRKWFATLRNVSSSFIARRDVREIVFTRDNFCCCYCGSDENLQVDHIVSVKACSEGLIKFEDLNKSLNLQTLCRSCNAKKTP